MTIILASGSQYKRRLIEKLGIPVSCLAPDIDETPLPNETPEAQAKRLSIAKARAIASSQNGQLIIGTDQVADLGGQPLGKPGNFANAQAQLRACRGRTVLFHTGLCLLNPLTDSCHYSSSTYSVTFRALSDAQIDFYLQREQPYDCAGSFKSEGLGIALFEHIRGDDPNSLIGLPLIELTRMLWMEGIDVLNPAARPQQ